jgi:alpha-glucosidase (family GH31 glycosyl hydrolase)
MLGPDYLFSPVTEYNATSWQVYLPKLGPSDTQGFGQESNADVSVVEATWVHHYTNTSYRGGQVHTIDVSDLDTFPLFKRTDSHYA